MITPTLEALRDQLRGKERLARAGWDSLRGLRGDRWVTRAIVQVRVLTQVAMAMLEIAFVAPVGEALESRKLAALKLKSAAMLLDTAATELDRDVVAVDSGPVVAASNEKPERTERRAELRVVS